MIVILWLGAAALLLAVELHHMAFFAMFASVGALGGAIVAAIAPHAYPAQFLTAAAVCVVGVVVARPFVSRAFARRHEGSVPLGVHGGIVGATVDVLDTVSTRPGGHVRLLGETWLAVCGLHEQFAVGEVATVASVSGTTLTIRRSSSDLR